VILRYFNSYGPGEVPGKYRNVIPNFIWLALNNQNLKITGTGAETRDFTYVSDIVEGTLLAGQNEKAIGEVFNLGRGAETKVLDLANRINRVSGNKAELLFTQPRDWDSIKRRCASIEKAKRILGYNPKTELGEGLKNTYGWILEKRDYISKTIK
jgi:UDP-glucose 4-epimerase